MPDNSGTGSGSGSGSGSGGGSGSGSGGGGGNGGGPTAIHLFRSCASVSIFYGFGDKPYRFYASGVYGENFFRLDSATIASGVKIEIHNLNASNVVSSEIGNTKFIKPNNQSFVSGDAAFNAVTDTSGKVYVRIIRIDGQSMTITGQSSPVSDIILPLVSSFAASVGDGCFAAHQPQFNLNSMAGIYADASHSNNPCQQSYKLVQ